MVNSHNLCGFLGKSLGTREDEKMCFSTFLRLPIHGYQWKQTHIISAFLSSYTVNNQKQTQPKCMAFSYSPSRWGLIIILKSKTHFLVGLPDLELRFIMEASLSF